MVRLISAIVLVLLIATPSLGQQSLVGTYKLVSLALEADGTPYKQMGKSPEGYLVLTPTHLITLYVAENRKFGTSVDEKAALLDSMASYAGVYRVGGNKIIYTTEIIWIENGKGLTRVETFELSGNRLTTILGPMPFPRDPSKTFISRKVWEKIE
jgi:hypothetical protein